MTIQNLWSRLPSVSFSSPLTVLVVQFLCHSLKLCVSPSLLESGSCRTHKGLGDLLSPAPPRVAPDPQSEESRGYMNAVFSVTVLGSHCHTQAYLTLVMVV